MARTFDEQLKSVLEAIQAHVEYDLFGPDKSRLHNRIIQRKFETGDTPRMLVHETGIRVCPICWTVPKLRPDGRHECIVCRILLLPEDNEDREKAF